MTYTDTQLKQALAKMLPEKLLGYTKSDHEDYSEEYFHFEWRECDGHNHFDPVLDTELLHLCWLIWNTLSRKQRIAYSVYLRETVILSGGHASSFEEDIIACCENATWQQRTPALAKMKGIEIV